jgi:hypothetical protein
MDTVFGQYLFEGILLQPQEEDNEEAKTVNEYILRKQTYKKAIRMSKKEVLRLPKRFA